LLRVARNNSSCCAVLPLLPWSDRVRKRKGGKEKTEERKKEREKDREREKEREEASTVRA